MHETSAKILQISSWVVPSFIHGNKITAIRLVFFKFSFFLMEKTNERNIHGPKGMVILHNFMCSLLPCLFVFQNVCLFRSVLLMIFAAIFRQCRKFNIHALNSIQTNSIYKVLCKRLAVECFCQKQLWRIYYLRPMSDSHFDIKPREPK